MPGGRANSTVAREVRGNLTACVPSPTLRAGQPRGSSWDYLPRASASVIHAPLHFTLPFLHPCPLECSTRAVRPPTRMKAKNTTDKLATAFPLALKQAEPFDWVLDAASAFAPLVSHGTLVFVVYN